MVSTIHAKAGTRGFTSQHRPIQAMPAISSSSHVPLTTHASMQHKEAMDLTSMEVALHVTNLMQEEITLGAVHK